MLFTLRDDVQNWTNYAAEPWPAEVKRVNRIIGDPRKARDFLTFGFRPLSILDDDPGVPSLLPRPFEVTDAHLSDEDILVDIFTGLRFRRWPQTGEILFDLLASKNYIDAIEILMLAANRSKRFSFETFTRPTYIGAGPHPYTSAPRHAQPLNLHVSTRPELDDLLGDLNTLFCKVCPSRKLWLRGQRKEYRLERSHELSQALYGSSGEISIRPSAGRYAENHPEDMHYGFAWGAPPPIDERAAGEGRVDSPHYWKKPFLIWLMRENSHWFSRDLRALDVLAQVLADDDDMRFASVLNALQMNSQLAGLDEDIIWPDEADDLRQWFFAFMKPQSFGITLQQYGYVSSLLDLTDDLEVALYFTQAAMTTDRRMLKRPPEAGRVLYVFAERPTGDFFRSGPDLFWGDNSWTKRLPPRLERQHAGFLSGSTCRTRNFYASMVVARIYLEGDGLETSLSDEDLFPPPECDLLSATLRESRPVLRGLY